MKAGMETETRPHQNEKAAVRITVDRRERDTEPFNLLREASWVELREEELKAGDYRLRDRLVMERKTGTDLIQSIISNRLFQQCNRLRTEANPCFLLVEGNPYRAGRNMHPEAIRGALVSITVFWCIPVLFSEDPEDTVATFRLIAEQYEREETYLNQRAFMKKRNLKNRQIHLLQGLPGIGAKKAKKLLEQFHTARNVLDAKKKQLKKVEGIGEKTAEKISQVLDSRWRESVSENPQER